MSEKLSAFKKLLVFFTLCTTLLMLLFIPGVFLLCWVPFFVSANIDAWNQILEDPTLPPLVFTLTTWLGYMNSFLNPAIYTIFNPEFRKAFKKILVGSF